MQGTIVLIYDDQTQQIEPLVSGAFKDNPALVYQIVHLFLDQIVVIPALGKTEKGNESKSV